MKRAELMGATIVDMTIKGNRLWSIKLMVPTGEEFILTTPDAFCPLLVDPVGHLDGAE